MSDVTGEGTLRSRAKASRTEALLAAAAKLFAAHGFNRVSIEDLGAAVGVSGPAVYRHFSSKHAVLAALLVSVSEDLLAGGRAVVDNATDDEDAVRSLIGFHVDFAVTRPDVIRVQDQDLGNLESEDQHTVRTLQRNYVELWVRVLKRRHPDVSAAVLRIRAHATFGLINSTPHTNKLNSWTPGHVSDGTVSDGTVSDGTVSDGTVRSILVDMARAALDPSVTTP